MKISNKTIYAFLSVLAITTTNATDSDPMHHLNDSDRKVTVNGIPFCITTSAKHYTEREKKLSLEDYELSVRKDQELIAEAKRTGRKLTPDEIKMSTAKISHPDYDKIKKYKDTIEIEEEGKRSPLFSTYYLGERVNASDYSDYTDIKGAKLNGDGLCLITSHTRNYVVSYLIKEGDDWKLQNHWVIPNAYPDPNEIAIIDLFSPDQIEFRITQKDTPNDTKRKFRFTKEDRSSKQYPMPWGLPPEAIKFFES